MAHKEKTAANLGEILEVLGVALFQGILLVSLIGLGKVKVVLVDALQLPLDEPRGVLWQRRHLSFQQQRHQHILSVRLNHHRAQGLGRGRDSQREEVARLPVLLQANIHHSSIVKVQERVKRLHCSSL